MKTRNWIKAALIASTVSLGADKARGQDIAIGESCIVENLRIGGGSNGIVSVTGHASNAGTPLARADIHLEILSTTGRKLGGKDARTNGTGRFRASFQTSGSVESVECGVRESAPTIRPVAETFDAPSDATPSRALADRAMSLADSMRMWAAEPLLTGDRRIEALDALMEIVQRLARKLDMMPLRVDMRRANSIVSACGEALEEDVSRALLANLTSRVDSLLRRRALARIACYDAAIAEDWEVVDASSTEASNLEISASRLARAFGPSGRGAGRPSSRASSRSCAEDYTIRYQSNSQSQTGGWYRIQGVTRSGAGREKVSIVLRSGGRLVGTTFTYTQPGGSFSTSVEAANVGSVSVELTCGR